MGERKIGVCGAGGWRITTADEIIDKVKTEAKRIEALNAKMTAAAAEMQFGPMPRNRAERRRAKYGKKKR